MGMADGACPELRRSQLAMCTPGIMQHTSPHLICHSVVILHPRLCLQQRYRCVPHTLKTCDSALNCRGAAAARHAFDTEPASRTEIVDWLAREWAQSVLEEQQKVGVLAIRRRLRLGATPGQAHRRSPRRLQLLHARSHAVLIPQRKGRGRAVVAEQSSELPSLVFRAH